MLSPSLIVVGALVFAEGVLGSSVILARQLDQVPALQARASFYGGWALSATTCPGYANVQCFSHACCPKNTVCDIDSLLGAVACCPDSNPCSSTIIPLPVCANSTWNLYMGPTHPFCCEPGFIGVLSGSSVGNGVCAQKGVAVPSSLVATQLQVAGATDVSNPTNTIAGVQPTSGSSGSSSGSSGSGSSSSGSGSGSGSGSSSGGSNSGTMNQSGSKHTGISTGVRAGIAVGAVLLIAACIAFFFLGFRRGRKNTATNQFNPPGPPPPAPAPYQQPIQQQQIPGTPAPYYDNISPPPQQQYPPPQGYVDVNKNNNSVNVIPQQQQQQQSFPELGQGKPGDKWVRPNASEMDPGRYGTPPVRHEMQ